MTRYKLYSDRLQTWSPLALKLEVIEDLKKKISTVNGIEPDENGNVEINVPVESDIKISTEERMNMFPSGTTEIPITIPNFDGNKNGVLLFRNSTKLPDSTYNIVDNLDGTFKVVFTSPTTGDGNYNLVSISGQGLSVTGSNNIWQEF